MNEAEGRVPPAWRLPEGVNASLWQYANSPRLAHEEDAYFRDHPLFAADTLALDARFTEPAPLIDLGCGAGRLSIHFARNGFPVAAVDLSRPMLEVVRRKSEVERLQVTTIQANLCRLGAVREGQFAYALAMFSTFGMIRGASARRKAMAEAGRILRPGGRLALHAHNILLNLHDAQGRRWLAGEVWRTLRGRHSELGDRTMTYRGVPGMQVHLFRWRELQADLHAAGLTIEEVLPIDAITARPIAWPGFLPGFRAGGWIVFARKG